MSTVITMTSWKQRIASVGQCIWMFYKVQCKKPDVFYLILSEAEFPNKERDLPRNLRINFIRRNTIKVHIYLINRFFSLSRHSNGDTFVYTLLNAVPTNPPVSRICVFPLCKIIVRVPFNVARYALYASSSNPR